MKKKHLLTSFLVTMIALATYAQEVTNKPAKVERVKRERVVREKREIKTPTMNYKNKQRDLYNHWSISLAAGVNKPVRPYFNDDYYSSDPNHYYKFNGVKHFDLGVRYMPSNIFGVKAGIGYDNISNQVNSGSEPFKSQLFTYTLEGVLNLGRLARFETFTNRVGLLVHAGISASFIKVLDRLSEPNKNFNYAGRTEDNGGLIFGVSPILRLNNRISFLVDFTAISNVRQHINWDGTYATDNNLDGLIYTTSIGLNIGLGSKNKQQADWYVVAPDEAVITDMTKRIVDLEAQLTDTDRDGVPDFRDLEPNTPNGLYVDQKGRFIDENKNGKPDQLEPKTVIAENNTGNIINNAVTTNGSDSNSGDVTTQLIQKGYFNIFYDINRDEPNDASSDNIYQIIKYLKSNPTAKVKLVGHTDKTGDAFANKELSERRAKSLFNLIKASGVDAGRIRIEGVGVDKDVPSEYKVGNNIARRVTVIIEQ